METRRRLLHYRRGAIYLFLAATAVLSLMTAYLLRFDFSIPHGEKAQLYLAIPLVLVAKMVAFRIAGLDQGWNRFVTVSDMFYVGVANVVGSALFFLAGVLIIGESFPRSAYIIDLMTCFVITAAARCAFRIYSEVVVSETSQAAKRILIYGAGTAGFTLAREIRMNPSLRYRVVGFLDDDAAKRDMVMMGLRVRGQGRDAARICATFARRHRPIDEIVIAMPSARNAEMRTALANCRAAGVHCKTVPGIGEMLTGKVLSSQLREVSVVDLLGRDPVELDETEIRGRIEGRSIMITGAAGSIGSELCRQVARFGPGKLILFEQAETDLFYINQELREKFSKLTVIPQIGDVRDYGRIEEVIRRHNVNSIFHAAAYKHVPLMEDHVLEAVKNNILGTNNVVTAARRNGVSDFVMISSDKAVNPTNIMGATKRVAELIVSALPRTMGSRTKCVSVRFGNVLGSKGSVIPSFQAQIAKGGPVTITHPDMRRYFMTIPEAVQLVLQASTMGKGSEVFVLEMGQPVRIMDLARNMIRLSGKEPDVDIEIRVTGLRPGEKLFEELNTEGENIIPTPHKKIMIFAGQRLSGTTVDHWLERLEALIAFRDERAVVAHIREIVPEFAPSEALRTPQIIRASAPAV